MIKKEFYRLNLCRAPIPKPESVLESMCIRSENYYISLKSPAEIKIVRKGNPRFSDKPLLFLTQGNVVGKFSDGESIILHTSQRYNVILVTDETMEAGYYQVAFEIEADTKAEFVIRADGYMAEKFLLLPDATAEETFKKRRIAEETRPYHSRILKLGFLEDTEDADRWSDEEDDEDEDMDRHPRPFRGAYYLRDDGKLVPLNKGLKCMHSYDGPGGEVTIPDNVASIGAEVFAYCDHVTGIVLSKQVESIREKAFYKSGIRHISICDSFLSIEESAFSDSMLESIELPDQVFFVKEKAFSGAKHLKTVKLPKGLKTLEPELFKDCSSLKKVILPEGLEHIEGRAFMNCTALETIALPESLISIWNFAFYGCSSLKEIYLGDKVSAKAIGCGAFMNCTALEGLRLPKDFAVDELPANAFAGDTRIKTEALTPKQREQFKSSLKPVAEKLAWIKEDGRSHIESEAAKRAANDPSIGTGTNGSPDLMANIWRYFDRLSQEERVRVLTHYFTVKGAIDGTGWASIELELDSEKTHFRISYIGNSPEDFKRFVTEIKDGQRGIFGWSSEPGYYEWKIQRRGGVFYVSAPQIERSFFIAREDFLKAVKGVRGVW